MVAKGGVTDRGAAGEGLVAVELADYQALLLIALMLSPSAGGGSSQGQAKGSVPSSVHGLVPRVRSDGRHEAALLLSSSMRSDTELDGPDYRPTRLLPVRSQALRPSSASGKKRGVASCLSCSIDHGLLSDSFSAPWLPSLPLGPPRRRDPRPPPPTRRPRMVESRSPAAHLLGPASLGLHPPSLERLEDSLVLVKPETVLARLCPAALLQSLLQPTGYNVTTGSSAG
jgi:hypothetical protein